MKAGILPYKGPIPLLFSSLLMVLCLAGCAQDSSILDNKQSRQLEFSVTAHGWNCSNSNSSDCKKDSRATPISGNIFDISKNFNVIADVNNGGNWCTEVNNETASYSTANKIWQTSATHYWPGSGSTVNFYAYYPISISSNITHATGSAPVLSYTVPDDPADQIDILASSKTGVVGNSYNQTSVDFKHIFAAVNFQVGTNGLPNGTITKVTLNNIQYKGIYNLDGTWTPNTTDKKSFSQAVSVSTNANTTITSGTMTFMMIPQTLSDASIIVTYSNGGTLTKTITGIWEAGKTYTYNLTKTMPVANFDYTGNVQTYTVPLTGIYKLEVWGAQGGGSSTTSGGKGAYVSGYLKLLKGVILYVYIGEHGDIFDTHDITRTETFESTKNKNDSGVFTLGRIDHLIFNNGGESVKIFSGWSYCGGGSTDIRLSNGEWDSFNSLKTRIMVAAGGGGACTYFENVEGGDAGALTGFSGKKNEGNDGNVATGGEQALGGMHGTGDHMYPKMPRANFGFTKYNYITAGGGGNGYYAGGNGNHGCGTVGSGAGGSSFISGYTGCNAISESSTSTNIIHTGSPDHYSGYVFTNMQMIAGNSSMPAPSGGTETGHSGNGSACITFVSAN